MAITRASTTVDGERDTIRRAARDSIVENHQAEQLAIQAGAARQRTRRSQAAARKTMMKKTVVKKPGKR
jgi:hypothetical protein